MIDGDDECHLVYVCRQNMALFAEVRRLTDDIIATGKHIGDPSDRRLFLLCPLYFVPLYINEVTDGDGVGRTDASDAEIAFYTAFHIRTIVQTNDVTATRGFDDETPHYTVMISFSLAA